MKDTKKIEDSLEHRTTFINKLKKQQNNLTLFSLKLNQKGSFGYWTNPLKSLKKANNTNRKVFESFAKKLYNCISIYEL